MVEPGDPTSTPTDAEPVEPTPQEYEIEYQGQKLTVPLDELKSGYQRQQDYTKKTQELAESKRQYQSYADFDKMLTDSPELAEEIGAIIQKQQGAKPDVTDYYDDNTPAPNPDIKDMKDQLAFTQDRLAEMSVETKIGKLIDRYPDAVPTDVVQYALDHNLGTDFEGAYKMMAFDEAVSRARTKGEEQGADAIVNEFTKRNLSFSNLGSGRTEPLPKQSLNSEQKSFAKRLGISDKDYLAGMKR